MDESLTQTKLHLNRYFQVLQQKFGSSKGRKSEPEKGATVLLKVKGKKNAGW